MAYMMKTINQNNWNRAMATTGGYTFMVGAIPVTIPNEENWTIVQKKKKVNKKKSFSNNTKKIVQGGQISRSYPKKGTKVRRGVEAFGKILKSYQNELEFRPTLPVTNSFAPLKIVKENTSNVKFKTLNELPPHFQQKYQVHKGRIEKKQVRKEWVVHKTTLTTSVRDRLTYPIGYQNPLPMQRRLGLPKMKKFPQRIKTHKKKVNQEQAWVHVIMTEEDDNDSSEDCSFNDLRRFNFSYNVEGDEDDELSTEHVLRGQAQTIHTRGQKKKDKATSSRGQEEGQELLHNPIHEEDEGEEEEARPHGERNEIELLRKEIIARDQQIADMEREQWLAAENCREMCEFLEMKGMLADLVIERSKRNGVRANKEERKKGKITEEEEEQGSGSPKVITSRNKERVVRGPSKSHDESKPEMTKKYIQEIVNQQLQVVGASHLIKSKRRIGRPYLKEFDLIPFPNGYVVPKFRLFDGSKGASPDQHLAHFSISCGNTAVEEAWLLRQFPQSLAGATFEWYASLE